jgi:hypothetical protein
LLYSKNQISCKKKVAFTSATKVHVTCSFLHITSRAVWSTERFGQSGSFLSTGNRHQACAKEPVVSFSTCPSHFKGISFKWGKWNEILRNFKLCSNITKKGMVFTKRCKQRHFLFDNFISEYICFFSLSHNQWRCFYSFNLFN